ncbi:MAG: helix-turn-helix domain-containing protein [Clostridia bacterium]|nr:helix-turn-helix domain-containing protein [Clostridia bacterium]
MYQIFVVEDELLIRQSIRNAIEHMQGPYAFCGEASDGEMALSIMQDLMPDILLTDIRMPFLDGFGLIKHARAMMPWLKVVIISGYGDFEYAQKAIDLGVDQYLLKPVRSQDLVRVIEEMAARIEKEKAQSAIPGGFRRDEVNQALRQRFTRQLLFDGADAATLIEQARTLDLDIIRACYQVTVCLFDAQDPDQKLLRLRVEQIMSVEEQTLYEFTAEDQLAILVCEGSEEALDERMYRLIGILKHELRDLCPVITAVIGTSVRRLAAISSSYRAAASLLKRVSTVSAGQVINAADTVQVAADIVSFDGVFGRDFLERISRAGAQDVPALLDSALSGPDGSAFDSTLMRYYGLIDLMRIAVQLIQRRSPGEDRKDIAARLSAKYDIFASSGDRDSFRRAAEGLLTDALGAARQTPADQKYAHVISQAEQYVRENYCDPNISLLSAARHVGMSSAHFSTVFSQTTGRPFIAYLTALRIERAKELLRTTNMRLSDIAMEIGYNEPNYFSHVFRKTEGVTPKEYRRDSQSEA